MYNTKLTPIGSMSWDVWGYLYDLGEELGLKDVMKVATEREQADPKEFKKALLNYCVKFGYEGSPMHNKFKRIPLKTIAKIIGK